MKKLNYLWMLGMLMFALVNFSSCSDDDNEGSTSGLVGIWDAVSNEGWEKYKGEIEDEWTDYDKIRVKFESDGTYTSYAFYNNNWNVEVSGKWQYKDGKIYTEYYDDEEDEYEASFATVKEFTDSRLVIEVYEKDGDWEYWERDVFRRVE